MDDPKKTSAKTAADTGVKSRPPAAATPPRRDEALVERFFRRIFDTMGAAVDRRFGREASFTSADGTNLTTSALVERIKRSITEAVFDDPKRGRLAPHLMRLKIEWGTHSEAPAEAIKELEHEVLAAAIDHINDNRYRTRTAVRVETSTDIFTTGIIVEPSFGEFESEIASARESGIAGAQAKPKAKPDERASDVKVEARIIIGAAKRAATLMFAPGGRRMNVGRAADNDLPLDHPSISKIHAAMRMNSDGTIILADTGSTNGTFVNGRRIAYGEARAIETGDTIAFGDVEVRFTKI